MNDKGRKVKKNIALLCVMLFIMVLACSACNGFKDIDRRIFVVGIGVDKSKEKNKAYRVTLKLANPSADNKSGEGPKYTYLSQDAENISEAVRTMKSRTDKELDFGHAKTIVLSDGIVAGNLRKTIDWFIRRRDIQQISWVSIGRTSAEKVLKAELKSEKLPGDALINPFDETGTESPYIVTTFLFDLRRRLADDGIDPILPIIEYNKNEKLFEINKSAVINNGGQPLSLGPDETKYFNALSNRFTNIDIKVKQNDLNFTMFVISLKAKYKIFTPDNEQPVLRMNVEMDGLIEESQTDLPMENMETYTRAASKEARKRIMEFLRLLQIRGIDPLGFGLRYQATRVSREDKYQQWLEIYPIIRFDVNVKANVKSTGTVE
ncbi:Ger(x)C family spore germination protein [Bacillus songklensis]|uniref:Ger(X)C family spore germination protein n=1 Tax=Bacillus songklensis TaxID=1069116 RepID=A0ABV8B001_9BACI